MPAILGRCPEGLGGKPARRSVWGTPVHNPRVNAQPSDLTREIAAVAARYVVEDGMEYGPAKRQAGHQLGLSAKAPWPDNLVMEAAVREYIAVFCPDTQAAELQALREQALVWMERLQDFQPHLGGAVWHGIATRHSDIHLHLFCDDPKAAELSLLDHRVDYQPGTATGWRGEPVDALTLRSRNTTLGQWVLVHLLVHDHDGLRGALKPDALGRKPRGDAKALRALLAGGAH